MANYLICTNMNPTTENPMKKCRVCLREIAEFDSLFEPLQDGISLADILETISTIKVERQLPMPQLICKNCSKIIVDFWYLVKLFYDSEEYLKTYLAKNAEEINKEKLGESNYISSEILIFHNEDDNATDNEETFYQPGEEEQDDLPLSSFVEKKKESNSIDNQAHQTFTVGVMKISTSETQEENVLNNESDIQEVPTKKYTCEICGDCFLFKSGFGHHMLMFHNICIQVNQYEQYSSEIVIKIPKGLQDVESKYVRKSNPPIPLYKTEVNCKKCKETFRTMEELKKHNDVHKTFRCDQCGAAFIKNSYLRDHLLKHSADKCYSCKDCGQAFKYRSALAVHRREHVGNNTGHMCETCGRNFKERGTLKTHIMLKHTNERKFPCSGCDLSFKLKAARDKHFMRKHTFNRTKDFICSMCGMAYLNKETLTRHITDKHSGAPSFHWCTVCHKSFTMKSNLSKHLKNKHNVIIKKE